MQLTEKENSGIKTFTPYKLMQFTEKARLKKNAFPVSFISQIDA